MPLASTFALQFYGPGCAAAVGADVTPTAFAELHGTVRLGAVGTAEAFSPLARGTQGKAMAAVNTSTASSPLARMRANARLGAVGKVNELSQDDVTGAVLESAIEGTLTLKEALRLILAATTNSASGLESGSPRFKSLDGSKDRIVATYSGGTRTVTSRDAT